MSEPRWVNGTTVARVGWRSETRETSSGVGTTRPGGRATGRSVIESVLDRSPSGRPPPRLPCPLPRSRGRTSRPREYLNCLGGARRRTTVRDKIRVPRLHWFCFRDGSTLGVDPLCLVFDYYFFDSMGHRIPSLFRHLFLVHTFPQRRGCSLHDPRSSVSPCSSWKYSGRVVLTTDGPGWLWEVVVPRSLSVSPLGNL